ncbi:S24 family peptidase, partial [Bartonella sp. CL71SXKL]|uniref:S24 family peptidase n=1 Tax=Bartonella sp. CL71SXKL TaxID=3243540 RepID=UPI0035CED0DD
RATITRYENGDRKANQDVLFNLADIFNVSVDDFFPPREKEDENVTNVVYPKGDAFNRVSIPIVGAIACGDPITAEENIDGYTEEVFNGSVPTGTLFALKCKGHSMEPTIPDGSLAIIHEQPEVEDGEIAAVLVDGDSEATLKRVKHQGKLVMLMPDNKDYSPIILDKDHPGRIVGKVIRYSVEL